MDISGFVEHLRTQEGYQEQIVHVEQIPARAARYGSLARPLPPALAQALAARGAESLYSHQAEAINAIRAGAHVIVATGTASGKSLCYHLPTLEAHLGDPLARALYIYPTKALAQDQMRSLRELSAGLRATEFGVYDGDTSPGTRSRLRRKAAVILTNPDMLHVGILPNHPSWAAFFRHLRYVVLDEAHSYRGVFGSHVACVLRRLRRVCALYGADPQFILASATVANPGEHAERLIGRPVSVVDDDGSPRGERTFVLWNPPMRDDRRDRRRSANSEGAALMAEMARQGLRNITFGRTRRVSELLLLYARQALKQTDPELAERVAAYRGGYLAEQRRAIEQQLFRGELLGVAATSALELGIDVGALDATLLVGYPGSIASTWQQAGRAGRGQRPALSILIGQDDPLDQYLMRHPEQLFDRPHEQALIDPGNPHILEGHLPCAAVESPLAPGDERLFGGEYAAAVAELAAQGRLEQHGERWFAVGEDHPAQRVSLRSASGDTYLLLDTEHGNRLLEEIDAETAFFRVFPGAIHLHHGDSYLITKLDIGRRMAFARRVEPDYYTQPREAGQVEIVRSTRARRAGPVPLYLGRVRVTQQVVGIVRRQQYTETLLSEDPLDLPPTSFETEALWFEAPAAALHAVSRRGLDWLGGLHAVEHACIAMLPLLAMCDPEDVGGLSTPAHADTGRPQIFLYDGYPGGVGISAAAYERLEELWQRTLETVSTCPCESGCPSCIQSPRCGSHNQPLDKEAACVILRTLLEGEGTVCQPGPSDV